MAAHGAHMRVEPEEEKPLVRPMPAWELPVAAVVLFLSSWAVSINAANALLPNAALRIVLPLAGVWCYRWLRSKPFTLRRGEIVALSAFCALLGLALLLGGHLHFTAGQYNADQSYNYIRPYSPADILTYVLQLPVIGVLCTSAYLAAAHREARTTGSRRLFSPARVDWRVVLILAAIFFAAWIPYLLAYWPGYIFGDSIQSLSQLAGNEPLNNHHPVLYTLFVGLCLNIGRGLFGNSNAGVALYSLVQMGIFALCLAYLSAWIQAHLDLSRWWLVAFVCLFGCTPYVANYSIAMWKDPFFSCSLVMLTLCLANYLIDLEQVPHHWQEATSQHPNPYPWSLALCALAAVFTRSNGGFICLVAAVVLALVLLRGHVIRLRPHVHVGTAALPWTLLTAATLVGMLITGPIFSAAGLNTDSKVESSGLLVNQMARVAATDGNLSAEDRSYLNALFPLEKYREAYAPSCVDHLKWSDGFDSSVLDHGLLGRWLSIGIKNPGTYFEAWQLETAGFWSLGYEGQDYYNIALGVPVNLQEQYQRDGAGDTRGQGQQSGDSSFSSPAAAQKLSDTYGIDVTSLLPLEVRDVLVSDEWSVPAGWILWFTVFALICLVGAGYGTWALALTPGLGLMATLVLASPIIYWPRYALACQLLLPFYAALLAKAHLAERQIR